MQLTTEQLATLLAKAKREPRRNLKRFLKDLGGAGSAAEVDEVLKVAMADPKAVAISQQLDRDRQAAIASVYQGVELQHSALMSDMQQLQLNRSIPDYQLERLCDLTTGCIAKFRDGRLRAPLDSMLRIAAALGSSLRMLPH